MAGSICREPTLQAVTRIVGVTAHRVRHMWTWRHSPDSPQSWLCAIAHRAGDLCAQRQRLQEGAMPTMFVVSCRKDFWSATEFSTADEIRELDLDNGHGPVITPA